MSARNICWSVLQRIEKRKKSNGGDIMADHMPSTAWVNGSVVHNTHIKVAIWLLSQQFLKMSSFYEASTSGMNWDRFTADVNDSLLSESTTLKVKQAYWSAKQLIREKLGRREDEHVVAADAELDMHLQQFRQIRDSTQTLLTLMETNQRELNDLAQLELDIAELLTDAQKDEKAHLRSVLQVTANAQANSSKQRQILLGHVIRFGNVLYDFIERAVMDCEQTVEAVERARLDYRGSLLWLKKSSETLDPADSSHMEDFRTVQQVVKGQKHRMDLLKEDVTLKVNVLHEARNRILAVHLEEYKTALVLFHSDIAAEFCASSEQFDGLESYEIDVLKILRDPIGLAMEEQHNSEMDTTSSPKRFKSPLPSSSRNRLHSESDTNDLVELEEVELGVEACDPAMERVRELLRFEDDSEDQAERGHVPVENDLLGLAQSDVQWKSPPTAAGIGLNLLKHSSSSTTELLNELHQEWGSLAGCSSSNGKQAVNTAIDEQTLKSAKPGTGRGALLEEIEDLLFESCPSSPKNNNSNLESNLDLDNTLAFFESKNVTVGNNFELQPNCNDLKCAKTEKGVGAENVPKLAPPPSHAATLCIKKKD